jgi:uncharacterized protein YndB with AHSA1/START domain
VAQTETLPIIDESIDIEAPIAVVYAALIEPDQVMQWWDNGEHYRITSYDAERRVGGAWRTTGTNKAGEQFEISGVYRVLDPPNVIEFTWYNDWHDGDTPDDTVVRYELTAQGNTTHLRVLHSGFTVPSEHTGHTNGWREVLTWVRDYAQKHASG